MGAWLLFLRARFARDCPSTSLPQILDTPLIVALFLKVSYTHSVSTTCRADSSNSVVISLWWYDKVVVVDLSYYKDASIVPQGCISVGEFEAKAVTDTYKG